MNSTALSNIPAYIGYSTIAYLLYRAGLVVAYKLHKSNIQRYNHPNRESKDEKEAWALVTGASSGIGLAFVHALAARNFNVILHGRNEQKLNGVIAELKKKYKVSFKVLVLESQTPAGPDFDNTVMSCVQGLNLTVVVHNVGGPAKPEHQIMMLHEDFTAEEVDGWLDVNVRFSCHLTRLLLPILVKNQPGLMLYTSSAAGTLAVPKASLYSGAKAYLDAYAKSLDMEMSTQGYDIEFKSLVTGTVATATSGRSEKDRSPAMPLTGEFVESCINTVGWDEAVVIPWWGHQAQLAAMTKMPTWISRLMMKSMLKQAEAGFAKVQKKK